MPTMKFQSRIKDLTANQTDVPASSYEYKKDSPSLDATIEVEASYEAYVRLSIITITYSGNKTLKTGEVPLHYPENASLNRDNLSADLSVEFSMNGQKCPKYFQFTFPDVEHYEEFKQLTWAQEKQSPVTNEIKVDDKVPQKNVAVDENKVGGKKKQCSVL